MERYEGHQSSLVIALYGGPEVKKHGAIPPLFHICMHGVIHR
jgi:hypothetical protein